MKRGREGIGGGQPNAKKANTGMPKVQDALGYLEKVKTRFQNEQSVYNKFLDIMKEFKSQAIDTDGVIKRVKELFKGDRQLILGFNQFLPPGYEIELEPEPKHNLEFNHAVEYVSKIKQRFRNKPEIYSEFLDILHDYEAKRTIDEVYQRVQKLFAGQQDLLDQFRYFLPDANGQVQAPPQRGRKGRNRGGSHRMQDDKAASRKIEQGTRTVTYPPGTEKERSLFERIKQHVSPTQWLQFLKCLNMFANDIVSRPELVRMVEDVLGHNSEYSERFKAAIDYDEWHERQLLLHHGENYYTFVSSVDFSTCKEVSRSYRQLPGTIQLPICSGRSAMCESLLNNECISIPTGSEDFSFKSTRKNVYEENLFKCEDERYELDMVIENNASTIRVLEPICEQVSRLSAEAAKRFKLDDSLHILHIRAVARLYGDQGYEVVQLLKKSPSTAAPVILQRLKQKDAEYRRVRIEMKKPWRKICEQNYHRSLDHRSFYFKQEDKKRRAGKALITELRATHNKVFNKKQDDEEDKVLSFSARLQSLEAEKKPLYTYCMRFTYDNQDVHRLLLKVVFRAAVQQVHPEMREKMLVFWLGFVHHFFGVELTDAEKNAIRQEARGEEEKDEEAEKKAAAAAAVAAAASKKASRKNDETDEEMIVDEVGDVAKAKASTDGQATAEEGKEAAAPAAAPAAESAASSNESSPEPTGPVVPDIAAMNAAPAEAAGRVKPLRVMMDTWELEEKLSPVRRHKRPSRLFFCSNAYYVLFRLHQLLYHRLAIAVDLAKNHKPRKRKKKIPLSPAERRVKLNRLLMELVDGEIEPSKFEDEVRNLLGSSTQSYVLFTLDKLLAQLLKQCGAILSSETCMKLLSLYQYEFSRSREVEPSLETSAQLARVYHSNCAALIGDDNCCQVEFFDDTKEMGVGLIEGLASPAPKVVNAEWEKYLNTHLTTPAALPEAPAGVQRMLPFLPRVVRKAWLSPEKAEAAKAAAAAQAKAAAAAAAPKGKKKGKSRKLSKKAAAAAAEKEKAAQEAAAAAAAAAASAEGLMTADPLKDVELSYGLKAQICTSTFKVHYVEDSEDVLVRRRGASQWREQLPEYEEGWEPRGQELEQEKAVLAKHKQWVEQTKARRAARKLKNKEKMRAWHAQRMQALGSEAASTAVAASAANAGEGQVAMDTSSGDTAASNAATATRVA